MEWLRRNIQLVRNPEIFDLDNITNKKNRSDSYLSEEYEDNIILQNRSFSYNIQNIFMKFFLNKLSNPESEFMHILSNTHIFLNYNEFHKYQNNSGKRVIENILELKDKQRTFDNCFNIEYALQKFHAQTIINKLDEKLNKNIKDEKIINLYKKIKNILNNYNLIRNKEVVENFNNYDGIFENDRNERQDFKDYKGRKTEVRKVFGSLTKTNNEDYERNNSSILRKTLYESPNFLLRGTDNNISKNVFKFYNENGFLEFINEFENMLDNEQINIQDQLFEQKINQQILDIILKSEDIFPDHNNNTININNSNIKIEPKKKDTINEKEKINIVSMDIMPKNGKEEEDKDFLDIHNLEGINDNKFIDDEVKKDYIKDEDIITFENINEEDNNNYIINEGEDEVNHKSQYYLFIALILEEILENKEKTDKLIEKININKNVKMNIKSLILKIYRIAFNYSGIKHRDFPYYSYYNFLMSLNNEELDLLKNDFNDLTEEQSELFHIFGYVKLKKLKQIENKKIKEEEEEKKIQSDNKNEEKEHIKHYIGKEMDEFTENKGCCYIF